MYLITQGSVFKRTYQAASRLHNLSKVQPLSCVAAFRGAAFFFYPPYYREDVGRKTHEPVYSKRLT